MEAKAQRKRIALDTERAKMELARAARRARGRKRYLFCEILYCSLIFRFFQLNVALFVWRGANPGIIEATEEEAAEEQVAPLQGITRR